MNLNLTNFSLSNTDICLTAQGAYNGACLYRQLCPQIPAYLVTYGIGILAANMICATAFFMLRRMRTIIPPMGDIDIPLGFFRLYFPMDFSLESTIQWWESYMNEMILTASSIYIFVVLFWAIGR